MYYEVVNKNYVYGNIDITENLIRLVKCMKLKKNDCNCKGSGQVVRIQPQLAKKTT